MTKTARIAAVFAVTVVLLALVVWYVGGFLRSRPSSVAAPVAATAHEANLTLQTVAAVSSGPRPDWVSYLIRNSAGQWQHSTVFRLPAHALIHVTLYQFDGNTGLRNPFWARPRGVEGNSITLDGKTVEAINPDDASHTFAVPDLGISVPLPGIPDDAKNPCGAAPCQLSFDHRTVQFTFRTGAPGQYRWQCFVPCAAGFYFGFGGPMQTIGYMDGFLNVV